MVQKNYMFHTFSDLFLLSKRKHDWIKIHILPKLCKSTCHIICKFLFLAHKKYSNRVPAKDMGVPSSIYIWNLAALQVDF